MVLLDTKPYDSCADWLSLLGFVYRVLQSLPAHHKHTKQVAPKDEILSHTDYIPLTGCACGLKI